MKNGLLKNIVTWAIPILGMFIYSRTVEAENKILQVGGMTAGLGLISVGMSLAFYPDESREKYWREEAFENLNKAMQAHEEYMEERQNLLLKLQSLEQRVIEAEEDNQEILERIGVPSNYLHLLEIVEKN